MRRCHCHPASGRSPPTGPAYPVASDPNFVLVREPMEPEREKAWLQGLMTKEAAVRRILVLVVGVLALVGFAPVADIPEFTDWLEVVNMGPVVNSSVADSCVTISKNGLSLFFSSTRNAGMSRDLFVSERESTDADWGTPEPLETLNTTVWESCPALSLDEHRLYFTAPQGPYGGCGAGNSNDIFVSRRQDRRYDFGWEPPVNLGCAPSGPNSASGDQTPALFEDEAGRVLLYLASNRSGNWDHYQSVMSDDDSFGPATALTELNSTSTDQGITVRRDGLEVFFLSNRPGGSGSGGLDFWRATRTSTADPWEEPEFVPSLGNPSWAQGKISLSFDGRELYFTSWNEPTSGSADLWVARRERVRGKK